MKKKWKIFYIVCAISGAVGIVLLVMAFSMGVSFEKVDSMMPGNISIGTFEEVEPSEEYTDDEMDHYKDADSYNEYEEITALNIDLKAGEVEILESDGACVEIETEGISEKLKLSYYVKRNTLVVDSTDTLSGIVNQNLGTVYIYLPHEIKLEDVKIDVGAGTLYVESIVTDNLSVDVGAGVADIRSFTAKRADFDCGAGEITLHGVVEKEIDMDCGMGSINYDTPDCEEYYNYKITCGVGKIVCGLNSYSGIASEREIDNHASKEMDIDCGIGEVIVEFEGHHEEFYEEEHF